MTGCDSPHSSRGGYQQECNLLQLQNHGFARRAAIVEVCRDEGTRDEVVEEREGKSGEVDGEVREGWEGDLELWGKAVRRFVLCESTYEALRGEEVGM